MKENNFWKGRNVFITGATGFLGSWLAQSLVRLKANVIGLDRNFPPNSYLKLTQTANKITLVDGDLKNYSLLERIFNEHRIDTCFHLAAQPLVTTADRFPLATFESNIRGTWNILEAARKTAHLRCLVVASSDKAYGSHPKLPYKEDFPLQGIHVYDVSKTCTDLLTQSYIHSYKLPAAIVRCGNFYGPGDLYFDRLIPGTCQSLIFNENPLIRSDGAYLRDYIYIDDVVNAYLKVAENFDRVNGEALNFGTGKPRSVLEVVNALIKISGKKNLKPKILNTAKNEIKDQYLDSEKAKELLDWKPKFDTRQTLKITYGWYKNFLT